LTSLDLGSNKLTKLPKDIVFLTKLKSFSFSGDKNLILSKNQNDWIQKLKENGCNVTRYVPTIDIDEDKLPF